MMLKAGSVLKDKDFLIFDLDDTLIDSYENHKQGIFEIVKEFSVSPNVYQKLLEDMEEHGRNRLSRRSLYELYIDDDLDKIDAVYWRGVGRFIVAHQDAINFIGVAKGMMSKSVSIVTNGGEVQQKKLDLVKQAFGDVFDSMMYTGQYGQEHYKPDNLCLKLTMERLLGRPVEDSDKKKFVYIGDRLDTDYEMCKRTAIDFVLIDRNKKAKEKVDCLSVASLEELICIQ